MLLTLPNTISRGSGHRTLHSLCCLAAAMALAAIAAVPASANSVTFAQYFETTGNQEWSINTTADSTTITATGTEFFEFNNTTTAYNGQILTADFSLSVTSDTAGNCGVSCGADDTLTQQGYSGTFSFTDVGGPLNGLVLLGGTFSSTSPNTGATLLCNVGETCTGLGGSTSVAQPTQVTFSSDVPGLSFATQTSLTAAFSFSSQNPGALTIGPVTDDTAYPSGTYNLAGSGTFSTTPGFVPEPNSMTLIGIGLCGIAVLSRRFRPKGTTR